MRFAAALILLIAAAGCMGEPRDTHFTVAEDAGQFQDAHACDGYDLRVRVTDSNGTPVAGAAVVWFRGGDGLMAFTGSGAVGPQGARGDANMEVAFTRSGAEALAGARTGTDGVATADLEPGRSVHVAAGDAQGMTTEVRFNVAVGAGGEAGTITLVLYPERIAFSQAVAMGNHLGIGGHVGQPAQEAWPLELSPDAGLARELRARIHTLDLVATWENAPGQAADLYVGLGIDASEPIWVGQDQQQYLVDGRQTETLFVEDFDVARDQLDRGLHVFLLSDWISAGLDGVAVDLEGEAVLKGSNVVIN